MFNNIFKQFDFSFDLIFAPKMPAFLRIFFGRKNSRIKKLSVTVFKNEIFLMIFRHCVVLFLPKD